MVIFNAVERDTAQFADDWKRWLRESTQCDAKVWNTVSVRNGVAHVFLSGTFRCQNCPAKYAAIAHCERSDRGSAMFSTKCCGHGSVPLELLECHKYTATSFSIF
jgi:hypothetical protein